MSFLPRHYQHLFLSIVLSIFSVTPLHADKLSKTIQTENTIHHHAVKSQHKIDNLDDRTRSMLEQFRSATRQTRTLNTYTQHLQSLLDSQEAEKRLFELQLQEIETTQREIVPLIIDMQQSLEQFVSLDLPFLPEERQNRIKRLKTMMPRADVSNAEKFRRLLEAYKIENEYGNTIEAYRANITLDGNISSVDFLRIGRVALYYQRLDGSETGVWNTTAKAWQILPSEFRNSIRQGLRIARKEAAPDLIALPIKVVAGINP